ncbi:C4-dicarboxylate ABC transporter substrate-binding protein [Zobellella endophytica]|uniref:C4-dicarboxylate ABC transporter substrate-binding protein n=1 Tax=Zobellella endophytica TaxID=2116700 RepID=A0A2P7R1R2_9GAMM|nr:DctP family TRAP transporter solute-binding subunit [Zobellella endophytica]PSJ44124.1 C4-dicarboxylate ABC transporter substrate-binding protein [Zobellella endophytica]
MRVNKTFTSLLRPLALACGLGAMSAQAVEINFGHVDPADWQTSKKGAATLLFKHLVEAESEGRVTVKLFPASQLGGETDMVQSVQDGILKMTAVSGAFSQVCPEAAVLDTPYIFKSAPVAWRVLDGDFGQKLAEHCLQKTGLRTLAYGETGYRHFTNSKRPVRTPKDMEGLKIRVQTMPLYVEMVKALGANPTPIPWPEVPTALGTGVVDGQENPVSVIYANKFDELQQYMTLDQHVYGTDFFLINDSFFQSLPEVDQEIIKRNAVIAGVMGRSIQQFNSAIGLTQLIENGMEVAVPTPAELEEFKQLAQPAVLKWLESQIDPSWISDLQQAVAEAEARL